MTGPKRRKSADTLRKESSEQMFQVMALVTKYLYLFLLLLFTGTGYFLYLRKPSGAVCRDVYAYQAVIIALFNAISIMMIVLHARDAASAVQAAQAAGAQEAESAASSAWFEKYFSFLPSYITEDMIVTIGLYGLFMIGMYILLRTVYRHTNLFLWNCVYMLLSISFIVLYRLDPEVCRYQVYWIGVGFLVMNGVMLLFSGHWIWKIPSWVFLIVSLVLIVLPFVFPNEAYGSLNWVRIGSVSFQPSEFVKLTFAFYLAVLYTRKNKLTSILQAGIVTLVFALILLKQNDLGALLIFGILAWMMTFDYTQRFLVIWVGLLLVAAGAFAAYHLVGHVKIRFDIWLDPWSDVEGSGYQIAQSLFAIVNGGWFGLGLYQGNPEYIPVRTSDMIFAVICEEFGMLFGILLILVYLLMFLFVIETGRRERNVFRRNLLMAFGVLFVSQTFIIIGGVIKLIPLTGVTLPLISYGGSSLLSNCITIAIIEAVIRLYRLDKQEAREREREQKLLRENELQARPAPIGYYADGTPVYEQPEPSKAGRSASASPAAASPAAESRTQATKRTGTAKARPEGTGSAKKKQRRQGTLKPFDFDDPF